MLPRREPDPAVKRKGQGGVLNIRGAMYCSLMLLFESRSSSSLVVVREFCWMMQDYAEMINSSGLQGLFVVVCLVPDT